MKSPIKADSQTVMRYSNKILEIVDKQAEFTRGDLQSLIEAVVLNILMDVQKSRTSTNPK